MYHKVTDLRPNSIAVSVAAFEEQQRILNEEFKVVPAVDVLAYFKHGTPLPPRAVLLTFDDGYRDNLTNAYPILKRFGHPALLFVPTDFVGGRVLPHDEMLSVSNPTLDWEDLTSMLDVFEVGSHACSHRPLTKIPRANAIDEIRRSKDHLQSRLGREIRAFSYPKGSICDYDEGLTEAVMQAGYELCFTTIPGTNLADADPFSLKRVNVEDFGIRFFRNLLDGSADVLALKDTRVGYRAKAWANRALRSSTE